MKKFFDYIQIPNFDIAADAAATFKVVIKFWRHAPFAHKVWCFKCHLIAGTHDET